MFGSNTQIGFRSVDPDLSKIFLTAHVGFPSEPSNELNKLLFGHDHWMRKAFKYQTGFLFPPRHLGFLFLSLFHIFSVGSHIHLLCHGITPHQKRKVIQW